MTWWPVVYIFLSLAAMACLLPQFVRSLFAPLGSRKPFLGCIALEQQDIGRANDVYLRRWILLRTPLGGIYLHKILRDDHDKALHDHPWNAWAILLNRGYTECYAVIDPKTCECGHRAVSHVAGSGGCYLCIVRYESTPCTGFRARVREAYRYHRPFVPYYIATTHRHRLITHGRTVWSLVLVSGKKRSWGFWPGGRFCNSRRYDDALGICNDTAELSR